MDGDCLYYSKDLSVLYLYGDWLCEELMVRFRGKSFVCNGAVVVGWNDVVSIIGGYYCVPKRFHFGILKMLEGRGLVKKISKSRVMLL